MIRRWWRAFIDRLHDHDENTCNDCSAMFLRGYWARVADEKNQIRARDVARW